MFITNTAFRSPISGLFGNDSETYWHAAELALQHSWFLVTFIQAESDDEDAYEVGRTMLVSSMSEVEQLAYQNSGGLLRLDSVQVITPGHVNGTEQWKMDPLRAVWAAEEPSVEGQIAQIYETSAGLKYVCSMLGTPIDELKTQTLRFRAPAKESSC